MGEIYILKNKTNNKKYVGQTVNTFSKRMKMHKCGDQLIDRAIKKYGIENFDQYIFKNIPENLLDYFETNLIKRLNSLASQNGYNLDSGGHKNKHHSDSTKLKIKQKRSLQKFSNETKNKMSIARKGIYKKDKCYWYGKKRSAEDKLKMSISKKGKYTSEKSFVAKKVYCIELKRVFNCISDASRELNICSSNIVNCCKGKRKTAGNLHWEYCRG